MTRRRARLSVHRRNPIDEDQALLDEIRASGGELSLSEVRDGSGLTCAPAEILQVIAKNFGGGAAFTREQLTHELTGQLGCRGHQLREQAAASEVGKAIQVFLKRRIVEEFGEGTTETGRKTARFVLTQYGQEIALGDRVRKAEALSEDLVESEIDRYEREALAEQAELAHGARARGRRKSIKRVRTALALSRAAASGRAARREAQREADESAAAASAPPPASPSVTSRLEVRYSPEQGITLHGTIRSDAPAIKSAGGWKWFGRGGFWYVPQTRGRVLPEWRVDDKVKALERQGLTVRKVVDYASAPAAERFAADLERTDARRDRLEERAARVSSEAEARYESWRGQADAIPLGQPIIGARDRAFRDKLGKKLDKAIELRRDAQELSSRARAVQGRLARYLSSPGAMTRRIATLETDQRDLVRRLATSTGKHADYLRAKQTQNTDELAFLRSKLGEVRAQHAATVASSKRELTREAAQRLLDLTRGPSGILVSIKGDHARTLADEFFRAIGFHRDPRAAGDTWIDGGATVKFVVAPRTVQRFEGGRGAWEKRGSFGLIAFAYALRTVLSSVAAGLAPTARPSVHPVPSVAAEQTRALVAIARAIGAAAPKAAAPPSRPGVSSAWSESVSPNGHRKWLHKSGLVRIHDTQAPGPNRYQVLYNEKGRTLQSAAASSLEKALEQGARDVANLRRRAARKAARTSSLARLKTARALSRADASGRAARREAQREAEEASKRTKRDPKPRTVTYVEPHAAARKGRPCKLCHVKHRLDAHRHHRVDAPRVAYTLTGERLATKTNPSECPVKKKASRKPAKKTAKPQARKAPKPKRSKAKKRTVTRTVTTVKTTVRVNPTLADAAETWARKRGLRVPARGTPAWSGLYSAWQRSGMATNPKKHAKKKCAKKAPLAKKASRKRAAKKSCGCHGKKPSNPLLGVLAAAANPKPRPAKRSGPRAGQKIRFGDLTPAQKRAYRSAALKAARFHGIPLNEVEGEFMHAPPGSPRALVKVGDLASIDYVVTDKKSRRSRVRWTHAAGDHGRGKKKTKPEVVAADPQTGRKILVSRRGTRAGFSSARGLVG